MGYLPLQERDNRLAKVREIMDAKGLDMALVYYDEFNIGNGWYLTGWCPQFESGAVLVPRTGEPMILGGPESEPFAKLDSTITETRNFPVFMVPDEEYPNATIIDFPKLFAELNAKLGKVGGSAWSAPGACRPTATGRSSTASPASNWSTSPRTSSSCATSSRRGRCEQIRAAFALADFCYDAMKAQDRARRLRDRGGGRRRVRRAQPRRQRVRLQRDRRQRQALQRRRAHGQLQEARSRRDW